MSYTVNEYGFSTSFVISYNWFVMHLWYSKRAGHSELLLVISFAHVGVGGSLACVYSRIVDAGTESGDIFRVSRTRFS